MHLAVCLKWVDLRPEVDPLTGSVRTDSRFSGAGPADLAALEWALRLVDRLGGTVAALTFGPPEAEPMLRDALAVGADRAILVARGDDSDPPSEVVATSLAPACAQADLVCCGVHSTDRGTGAVPAFLAHRLGVGQALGLVPTATTDDTDDLLRSIGSSRAGAIVVERRLDYGRRERLRVLDRCVLSFEGGIELRRAALTATLAAKTTTVEIVEPGDGELAKAAIGARPPVVTSGPYRPRAKVKPPPSGSTHDRVVSLVASDADGPPSTAVQELPASDAASLVVDRLVDWGYVEPSPAGDRSTDRHDS
jgi:electron transfer flavoprotein beta subunit